MTGQLLTLLACALVTDRASAQGSAEKVLREIHEEKVINVEAGQKANVQILELQSPGITSSNYELRGTVQYDDVEGAGYLELLNHFPDGQSYFTTSTLESGPTRRLTGTSPPRPFVLPFHSRDGRFPTKLTVHVVLPGRGSVKVSGVKLVQWSGRGWSAGWWDGRVSGWLGGILGSIVGLLGATIRVLSASQRTRPVARGVAIVAALLCAVILIGGLIALSVGQPYHVWYPLLLCGAIGTFVLGGSIWIIRRQSAEYELRRMSAMDAPR